MLHLWQFLYIAIFNVAGVCYGLSSEAQLALFSILSFGWLGGIIFEMGYGAHKPKGCLPEINLPSLFGKYKLPPILGMILFAIIARNFFGDKMDSYDKKFMYYVQKYLLCLLQVRGGLAIQFTGLKL